ncbi:MAG: universal stress protein [Bacteroidota bacterium]
MKNILIATDFSENALDAAKFGIELAKKFHSKIYFLHVYSLPIANIESQFMLDFSFYQKIKTEELDKLVEGIDTGFLKTETHCVAGISLSSEVNDFCELNKVDLIVMGLTGASLIDEILMGSNTLHLVTHSKTPVLAIPKQYKFPREVKVGFAYDGKDIKNANNMHLFREFVKNINAFNVDTKINAFHVSNHDNGEEIYQKLKKIIPFEEFELQIEINDHVNEGILDYIANNEVNILGIVPRKHTFFDRLFHESYTKEFAKYSPIPFMTLPE